MARYGQAFKDRAVARLLPPESASVETVSRELGVSVSTLERWRADALSQPDGKRIWTAKARLEAVIATAAIVLLSGLGIVDARAPDEPRYLQVAEELRNEITGGVPPASPMPTPTLATASCQKLAAIPQSAVMALHSPTEMAITLRRDHRSASRATGTPRLA